MDEFLKHIVADLKAGKARRTTVRSLLAKRVSSGEAARSSASSESTCRRQWRCHGDFDQIRRGYGRIVTCKA